MQTPLQKLKEWLEDVIKQCEETYNATDKEKFPAISMTTDAMRYAYVNCLKEVESLLPTEREQIIYKNSNRIPEIEPEQLYPCDDAGE